MSMKITPEHLTELRRLVTEYDTPARRQEAIALGWKVSRYHYWLIGKPNVLPFVCNTLYPYLHDAHIDTAMRHIIPAIRE